MELEFLVACTFTHCVLKACKVSLISINGLRGVALTKKNNNKNPTNKQPGLTDGRTGQNILPFATSLRGI